MYNLVHNNVLKHVNTFLKITIPYKETFQKKKNIISVNCFDKNMYKKIAWHQRKLIQYPVKMYSFYLMNK